MKLAVFHTIFNAIGVAVMTPFTTKLVTFLERIIPTPKVTVVEPKYLNEARSEERRVGKECRSRWWRDH